jgi:phosphodiesterase/alkaline phosphatase D-like protein
VFPLNCYLLDVSAPDVNAIKDVEARSIMGGKQENWFYGELKNASSRGAQWKLVAQQIVCKSSPHHTTLAKLINASRAFGNIR